MEAREIVRKVADWESHVYWKENKQFRNMPKSTDSVPGKKCVPVKQLTEPWPTYLTGTIIGETYKCVRFQYEMVACPGHQECKTLLSEGKWKQDRYEQYFWIRARGDLNGDGSTSLFEQGNGYDPKEHSSAGLGHIHGPWVFNQYE